jgi:hypothetical protein
MLRIAIAAGLLVSVAACKQRNTAPDPAVPVTSETQSPGIPVANTADGSAANTGNLVNGTQGPTGKK